MTRPRLLYAFLASFAVIAAAGVYQLTTASEDESVPVPAAAAPSEPSADPVELP